MILIFIIISLLSMITFSCDPLCANCQNNQCLECFPSYYLNNLDCNPCPKNCLKCQSQDYCDSCSEGYFKSLAGHCLECDEVCTLCKDKLCQSCKFGFNLNNGICCPIGCKDCNIDGCTSCEIGYYFIDQGCIQCPTNCYKCEPSNCLICNSGYNLINGNCTRMTCNIIGCDVCNGNVCSVCSNGYYLSSGSCPKCPLGCSGCSSFMDCKTCSTGYTNRFGVCCRNKCISCNPLNPSQSCWSCEDGYILQDKLCVPCPSSCAVCTSEACLICVKGFYFKGGLCISCQDNCEECVIGAICSKCKTEYNNVQGQCLI